MKKILKFAKFLIIVVMPVILLGIAIKLLFFNYSLREVMNIQKTEDVYNNNWDDSVSQVIDYIKASLNDGDRYESVEWGKVKKIAGRNYDFVVRHKFRVKNGGKDLYNKIFYLNEKGVVVDVEDFTGN